MKLVITYPNGYERTVYVTNKIGEKIGETPGRVRNFLGTSRVYIRMGKPVIRKPGVMRRSYYVEKVNQVLKELKGSTNHPAVKCAGQPWREFLSCMSREMGEVISEKRKDEDKAPKKSTEAEKWLKRNY